MNLMQHNYRDNRDNVLHYRDIGILIIAQPYTTPVQYHYTTNDYYSQLPCSKFLYIYIHSKNCSEGLFG